jgi:large-conductance mechanosensitive channel
MSAARERLSFLFTSTKGLILVAIAMIALETAFFGFLSGPMEEFGVRGFMVRNLGLDLLPQEREGRIIILYHTIAMAVVAIQAYMITSLVPMKRSQQITVNAAITVGYLTSQIFGLWFAYFGHNYVFHGLFIFGQSLVFFAGVVLAYALWPWRAEYHTAETDRARTRGGVDLERVAFFTMAVAMLGSALFGAVPGSLFGNGFETFLAEDVVRNPVKTPLQLAVIGHLHIMLALIAVAMTLILSRWFDFRGRLHKWAMPLIIAGTLIITFGVWAVVPFEAIAHIIINVGSFPVLIGSWLLVWFGWRKITRERLAEQNLTRPSARQRLAALLHDPLRFGTLWQMVYMNFVVTALGIFMAIQLDEIIRQWPWREERVTLTGHWHVLAGIIATIILLYYADLAGLKGRARQWFGWVVIVASDLAFGAVALFETKRLFVSEAAQQTLVDYAILLTDIGLATVLVALAALMLWRLVDLLRRRGRWRTELEEARRQGQNEQEVLP